MLVASGFLVLQSNSWALAQDMGQPANDSVSCDQIVEGTFQNTRCNPRKGFCIPSLQTLLLDPLSRAGDRFEAAWRLPLGSHVLPLDRNAHCDALGVPMTQKLQCDSWLQPPSYLLYNQTSDELLQEDEPPKIDIQGFRGDQFKSMQQDDILSRELNEPVHVGPNKTAPESHRGNYTLQEWINPVDSDKSISTREPREIEQSTRKGQDVKLASSLEAANGVRLTGTTQVREFQQGERSHSGQLKEKYLQRKRLANSNPTPTASDR